MEAAVVVRRSEFVLRLELRCSMGLAIRMVECLEMIQNIDSPKADDA